MAGEEKSGSEAEEKGFWAFFKKIWLTVSGFFWDSFFWIMFVGGSVALGGGFYLESLSAENGGDGLFSVANVARFLLVFGQTILAAGVFAGILKFLQFKGFFREALSEIIYGDQFIGTRKDLPDVWKRVSSAMFKWRFPELEEPVYDGVLSKYLPTSEDYFYRDYHRKCTLAWMDDQQEIIRSIEELSIKLVPGKQGRSIIYEFDFRPIGGAGRQLNHPEIISLSINGKDLFKDGALVEKPPYPVKIEELEPEKEGDVSYYYKVTLEGEKEYCIERVTERIWPLDLDPYARYRSPRFTLNASLVVHCVASNLRVRFLSLGTVKEFENLAPKAVDKAREGDICRDYRHLLFPMQGYILVFQRFDDGKKVHLLDRQDTVTAQIKAERAAAPEAAKVGEHDDRPSDD